MFLYQGRYKASGGVIAVHAYVSSGFTVSGSYIYINFVICQIILLGNLVPIFRWCHYISTLDISMN